MDSLLFKQWMKPSLQQKQYSYTRTPLKERSVSRRPQRSSSLGRSSLHVFSGSKLRTSPSSAVRHPSVRSIHSLSWRKSPKLKESSRRRRRKQKKAEETRWYDKKELTTGRLRIAILQGSSPLSLIAAMILSASSRVKAVTVFEPSSPKTNKEVMLLRQSTFSQMNRVNKGGAGATKAILTAIQDYGCHLHGPPSTNSSGYCHSTTRRQSGYMSIPLHRLKEALVKAATRFEKIDFKRRDWTSRDRSSFDLLVDTRSVSENDSDMFNHESSRTRRGYGMGVVIKKTLKPSSASTSTGVQYKRMLLPTKKDGTYVGLQLSKQTYDTLRREERRKKLISLCDASSSTQKYIKSILIYLGFSSSLRCSDVDIIAFDTTITRSKRPVVSLSSTCTGVAVGERAFTTNFFTGNTLQFGIFSILALLKCLPTSIDRDRNGNWKRPSSFERTYTTDINDLYTKSLEDVDRVLRKT